MFEQLLKEIQAGGTLETSTLAARLGTTPYMVEAMLEHLQRTGAIQAYVSCSDSCLGCSLQDGCGKASQSKIRLWQSKSGS